MSEMVSLAVSISLDAANTGTVGISRRAITDQPTAQGVNTRETTTQRDLKKADTQLFTPEQLSEAMTAAAIRSDR